MCGLPGARRPAKAAAAWHERRWWCHTRQGGHARGWRLSTACTMPCANAARQPPSSSSAPLPDAIMDRRCNSAGARIRRHSDADMMKVFNSWTAGRRPNRSEPSGRHHGRAGRRHHSRAHPQVARRASSRRATLPTRRSIAVCRMGRMHPALASAVTRRWDEFYRRADCLPLTPDTEAVIMIGRLAARRAGSGRVHQARVHRRWSGSSPGRQRRRRREWAAGAIIAGGRERGREDGCAGAVQACTSKSPADMAHDARALGR